MFILTLVAWLTVQAIPLYALPLTPQRCEFGSDVLYKGAKIHHDPDAFVSMAYTIIPSVDFDSRQDLTSYQYFYLGENAMVVVFNNGRRIATIPPTDEKGENDENEKISRGLKIAVWAENEEVAKNAKIAMRTFTSSRKCRIAIYADKAFKTTFGENYKNVIHTHMRAADAVFKTTNFANYQYGFLWDVDNIHTINSPHDSVVTTIGWLASNYAGTTESGSTAPVCVNLYFSGKDYLESTIAGMAYKGVAGVDNSNHNVAMTSITNSQTLLFLAATHELGHTWGMSHDTDSCGTGFLMYPILGGHRDTFSLCSISEANDHLDRVTVGFVINQLNVDKVTSTTNPPPKITDAPTTNNDADDMSDKLIVILGALGGFLGVALIIFIVMWTTTRQKSIGL